MIILHILNSLSVGGLEKIVVNICNNINSKENQVYILLLNKSSRDLINELNPNIKIFELPINKDTYISKIKRWTIGVISFIKILREIKPNIIHSHQYFQDLLFVILSIKFSKTKPKFFRTIHTSGIFYEKKTIINKIRLSVEKKALTIYPAYFISISQKIFNNNESFFDLNMKLNNRLIYNGIDLKKFTKSNNHNTYDLKYNFHEFDNIITYVSRIDKGKNHICLLKAWKKVIKKHPSSLLCIVGDGNEIYKLKKFAEDNNLSENILFTGSTNNVINYLEVTNIAVFPSEFEGFSVSLLEKMAMSLPIIASDIDAFKEVIIHNKNGLLFSVYDENQLSKYICKLINDKTLSDYLGANAHESSKKFEIKNISEQTLIYYKDVL